MTKRLKAAGQFEFHPGVGRAGPDLPHHPDAVHVAGDQVAAQAVAQPDGPFQVYPVPHLFQGESRAGQGLGGHLEAGPGRVNRHHREAGPGHGHRLPQGELPGGKRGLDRQPEAPGHGGQTDQLANAFHQPGEHGLSYPLLPSCAPTGHLSRIAGESHVSALA